MSFVYTNLSLCELLISNCNSAMNTCCCKTSEKNNEPKTKIEKKCCCEVKESTSQPAEVSLYFLITGLKNLNLQTIFSGTYAVIDNSDKCISFLKVLSFHSPPKEDLHILNSNFRI